MRVDGEAALSQRPPTALLHASTADRHHSDLNSCRLAGRTAAAQRMTMRSFVLPPSRWRGWAGPSWGPWAAKGHASRTLAAHAPHTGSVSGRRQSVDAWRKSKGGSKSAFKKEKVKKTAQSHKNRTQLQSAAHSALRCLRVCRVRRQRARRRRRKSPSRRTRKFALSLSRARRLLVALACAQLERGIVVCARWTVRW